MSVKGLPICSSNSNFLSSSPSSFRLNMSETKCIIHLSIKLLTSPYFLFVSSKDEPSTHRSSDYFNVYCVTSIVLNMENAYLCVTQALGLRARERQTWWWKNLASVDRAQRRVCPKCLSGSSQRGCKEEGRLPRTLQVRRFSKKWWGNPNKGEREPTQEKRSSQELSGPEYSLTRRSARSQDSL